MIKLRRFLERGVRHPVWGPLLLLLLVVLLALIAMHEGSESFATDLGELCVGIAITLTVMVFLPRGHVGARVTVTTAGVRGPPEGQPEQRRPRPVAPQILLRL